MAWCARGPAEELEKEKEPEKSKGLLDSLNLSGRTLGGKQLWNDDLVCHDWRIQRNVLTGTCRLIDGADVRQAWGTFEHCERTFEKLRERKNIEPMRGRVVVLLHGLGRSRSAMAGISQHLVTEGKLNVVSVGYASTRADIHKHAERLGRILSRMNEVTQLDFVAHSMGNIVLRRYMAMQLDKKTRQPCAATIGRVVMLCPPNHGAQAAERLAPVNAVRFVGGPAFEQLGPEWASFKGSLAAPKCEFGILAGGRSDDEGYNPLIAGDDDMVISVATTKLAGARDYCVVPAPHTLFMDDKAVRQYTLNFLRDGHFVTKESRRALTADDEPKRTIDPKALEQPPAGER
jgi:pimeloyl-ACP methyl ester carboxylesterase